MKLFRALTGVKQDSAFGTSNSLIYVIANDFTEASEVVVKYLNNKGVGFQKERYVSELKEIAEDAQFPKCGYVLLFNSNELNIQDNGDDDDDGYPD